MINDTNYIYMYTGRKMEVIEMDLIDVWMLFFEKNLQYEEEEHLAFIREWRIKIQNFYEDVVSAYSLNGNDF